MNSGNINNNKQSTIGFQNLKSNFILKQVFDKLKQHKSLEVIKYNKQIQKRINISITDYIKYSQLYSPIEIELKFDGENYNKFINIPYKKEEYFHIYFNNENKEIKRNYLIINENVKTIKIIIDYQVNSLKGLFLDCKCINSICFKTFIRINIIDMSYMFSGCSSLKELNLSKFNTGNVTDMSYMFYECSSLKELNLSNFDTKNVIYMSFMFEGCSSLKELDLSNFNTDNVTTMSDMFNGCSTLKRLNLSNFESKNLNNIGYMFNGCSSLKELNISQFNIDNIKYQKKIFSGCSDELKNQIEEKYKNINFN